MCVKCWTGEPFMGHAGKQTMGQQSSESRPRSRNQKDVLASKARPISGDRSADTERFPFS
jgi:hypothetical protein